jgi:hypothetical protein
MQPAARILLRETLLPERISRSAALFASTLNQHVEGLTLMVNCKSQVQSPNGDPNDHLVEMPSLARAWAAQQPAPDQRAQLQHPAPHPFIGDVDPTLGEQIFDLAIAQGDPEIQRICVLNYSGRNQCRITSARPS